MNRIFIQIRQYEGIIIHRKFVKTLALIADNWSDALTVTEVKITHEMARRIVSCKTI